ncbi:DUF222 domain-containing protein [Gordonia sp. DT30]|uniref:HNH endonuclease signature motif containing protein n=1 Tax=unclassified Gordonia (in: high G+C Gram-positive bacteria) TaxID=2657482 RepID=UPI003CEE9600
MTVTQPPNLDQSSPDLVEKMAQLHALLDEIEAADPTGCTDAEIVGVVSEHERAMRRMDSISVSHYVETNDRAAYQEAGYTSMHAFLTGALNVSLGTAKRRRIQSAKLGSLRNMQGEKLSPDLPKTAKALAEGAISTAHVDVIIETMKRIPSSVPAIEHEVAESTLAFYAREMIPSSLRRVGVQILAHLDPDGQLTDDSDRKRRRSLHVEDADFQQMSKIWGTLDPVTRAQLDIVLAIWGEKGMNNPDDPDSPTGDPGQADPEQLRAAAARDDRCAEQRNHDAFAAVLRFALDAGALGKSHRGLPAHIIVAITESQLHEAAGAPAETATGAPIPIADLVEMAAESQHHLAVFADHTTEVLYFGTQRRQASQAQRLALIAKDGPGCTCPGCSTKAFDSVVHHITDVQDGGPTDITNLTFTCSPDNRHVGKLPDKWRTTIQPDGPDAGRTVWQPPAAHPNQDQKINHTHLAHDVVKRFRAAIERRYDEESRRKKGGSPESPDPPP